MAEREAPTPSVVVRHLGRTGYRATWEAMQRFTDARTAGTADELWLTEHPPVYTLGLAGRREHLLRANGIEVIKVDRGGQVTYHGPGQLVAYTLVDLRRAQLGIRELVRRLERAVVLWLGTHGIAAWGKVEAPGVYVRGGGETAPDRTGDRIGEPRSSVAARAVPAAFAEEAKVAALGLKVRRHCTYHGLAVNVAMDLAPFADIDPCGYPGLAVTDLARFGVQRTVAQAADEIAPHLVAALAARGEAEVAQKGPMLESSVQPPP